MSKVCKKCKLNKSEDEFYKQNGRLRPYCKECWKHIGIEYKHAARGVTPYNKAIGTSVYFGVYIAENVLEKVFKNIKRMPYGNPGYDFICGRGFKVDSKASRLHHRFAHRARWEFKIRNNKVADYFLLLGFNEDALNLEPKKMWIIPSEIINNRSSLCIKEESSNWKAFEYPIRSVLQCCDHMKQSARMKA